MKSKVIVVSGIVAAMFSLTAHAQVPDWYSMKHPEMKAMAALHAHAGDHTVSASPQLVASAGSGAASGNRIDWSDLKRPEMETMAHMRAQEEAHGRVAMHGVMAHQVDTGHDAQTPRS